MNRLVLMLEDKMCGDRGPQGPVHGRRSREACQARGGLRTLPRGGESLTGHDHPPPSPPTMSYGSFARCGIAFSRQSAHRRANATAPQHSHDAIAATTRLTWGSIHCEIERDSVRACSMHGGASTHMPRVPSRDPSEITRDLQPTTRAVRPQRARAPYRSIAWPTASSEAPLIASANVGCAWIV